MDKAIRVYTSPKEMKADEYRYWQSRPAQERMDAVAEITLATYAMKGAVLDVPRLQGPLICLQRWFPNLVLDGVREVVAFGRETHERVDRGAVSRR